MQKGENGVENLNILLQKAMNKNTLSIKHGGITYKLHDRVMQIRNNYDKEVFNGDVGFVSGVDIKEQKLTVDYDGKHVDYESAELDKLILAYATTIHKAQGSEFPIVVMPVTMSHKRMLQRNLLYTGVTRARKVLVLVGVREAVKYAVENVSVQGRNTRLGERLKTNK